MTAQRNKEAVRQVAEQILMVLPNRRSFDNNQQLRTLLKARIDLHWGKKINQVLKVLTLVEARQQVPSQFIGNLLELWKLQIISWELQPEDFQKFENSLISADQLMLGDEIFNKTLLACQSMSKRVVQWQLNVLFQYMPLTPRKNKSLIFFLIGWEKCSISFLITFIGVAT